MRTIIAFHGEEILVDSQDWSYLSRFRWYINTNGYAARTTSRTLGRQQHVTMHTEILERKGFPRGTYEVCDHRNRQKLDNRRRNLRATTQLVNARNRDQSLLTGRPRVLSDWPPRDCEMCGKTFTPPRKSAREKSTLCGLRCQRAKVLPLDSESQRRRSLLRFKEVRPT